MLGAYGRMASNTATTYWRVLHYVCIVYVDYAPVSAVCRGEAANRNIEQQVRHAKAFDKLVPLFISHLVRPQL